MLVSSKPIKCLNWNVEWRTPRSAGGKWITQKIGELDPDVSCLTEITEALIPEERFFDRIWIMDTKTRATGEGYFVEQGTVDEN